MDVRVHLLLLRLPEAGAGLLPGPAAALGVLGVTGVVDRARARRRGRRRPRRRGATGRRPRVGPR